MSNIQTLQAQREALEKQISESRAAAITEVRGIMQSFSIKPWELVKGGKRPGRPSGKNAPVTAQETLAETQTEAANPAPTLEQVGSPEWPTKPAKGSKGKSKGKQTPEAEPAVM